MLVDAKGKKKGDIQVQRCIHATFFFDPTVSKDGCLTG